MVGSIKIYYIHRKVYYPRMKSRHPWMAKPTDGMHHSQYSNPLFKRPLPLNLLDHVCSAFST